MSQLVKSEGISLYQCTEATFNTQATTGYSLLQPNAGGLTDFYLKVIHKARNPLTKNRQLEAGDIVDADASPKIVHDLTKDFLDRFGSLAFLSAEKFGGGTGVGKFYPTAVITTAYTVPAGGALPINGLVYGRGFANAANNGLQTLITGSTSTSIKTVATLVAETPPANATVEWCGIQGASGDITCTATQLLSTVLNFTTLGLIVNEWLWVGGGTLAAPGAFGFATAGCRGFVRITAIAANAITFDRPTQAFSTDSGAGKTIQLFFGSFLRNVEIDNTDALDPQSGNASMDLVLAMPGLDTAGATDYLSLTGGVVDTLEINGAAQDLVRATVSLKGCTITAPSTTIPTGISTALTPLAQAPLNVVTELPRLRVADASVGNYNAAVSVDIETWKLTIMNHVTAQKQQGQLGPVRMIPGVFEVDLDVSIFLTQPDLINAMKSNITLMAEGCLRNGDCGIVWDLPAMKADAGAPAFPENGVVTLATKLNANRDTTYNYTLGVTKFPFLPAT